MFIDLAKAYDSVSRLKLWDKLTTTLQVPSELVTIIRNMYVEAKGIVCVEG